jgi:hypothetical protein
MYCTHSDCVFVALVILGENLTRRIKRHLWCVRSAIFFHINSLTARRSEKVIEHNVFVLIFSINVF